MIRDNDAKFGTLFDRVAERRGIEIVRTPYRALRANAICEKFVGSVRRECLDQLLIFSDAQLDRLIKEYVGYFNEARPHQGIGQQIPGHMGSTKEANREGKIISVPILNGLQHDYRRVA